MKELSGVNPGEVAIVCHGDVAYGMLRSNGQLSKLTLRQYYSVPPFFVGHEGSPLLLFLLDDGQRPLGANAP